MSAEEFTRWKILYYKYGAFGESRDDARFGLGMSTLMNLMMALSGLKGTQYKPSDFVSDVKPVKKKGSKVEKPVKPKLEIQSQADMKAIARALAGMK